MAKPGANTHGVLGGVKIRLDQNAPEEIGRPAYRHFSRSLFRRGLDVTGRPGSQNLREERLVWDITNWDGGEGQVVVDPGDDQSPRSFYRSEGLDFRVPGQVTLNKSSQINSPADSTGSGATESEGSAWADVTGTSTVVNTTDRRLNLASGPDMVDSATHTPGASQVQVKFHLYKEGLQSTTVEGNAFVKISGGGNFSGTNYVFPADKEGEARTVNLTASATTSILTAGVPQVASVVLSAIASTNSNIRLRVEEFNAGGASRIVATTGSITGMDGSLLSFSTTFTPISGRTYRLRFDGKGVTIDNAVYGATSQPTTVTLQVRNTTSSTTVVEKQLQITNTTSAVVSTLNYTAAAATNFKYRMRFDSGPQRPIVDKTAASVLTTGAWSFGNMMLGLDGNIHLVGHRTGTSPATWIYDFANEDWDEYNTTLNAIGNNAICRALAYSDKFMYALFDDGQVEKYASGTTDDDYVEGLTDPTGMTICQDRLFVLTEDDAGTNGIQVRTYAVDADVSGGVTSALQTVTVSTAVMAADTDLRERMVGTPSGARFFVNYSDVQSVIYQADASGSTTTVTEIARLDLGAKATAIEYVGGLTFIAGQFKAETNQTARCALWVIDQNSVLRRIDYFRRDDPTAAAVVSIQAYQNDLWMLQGKFIWRYSLSSGGLFLEYELTPGTQGNARSIAVLQGHVFAMYSAEDATNTGGVVWVTGSVSTYRQSSVNEGNSFTTSVYDYALPGEDKLIRTVKVITDTMLTATSVFVEANYDQTKSSDVLVWTPIGTHTTGNETEIVVSTAERTFKTVQFRITLSSGTGANTPNLKAVVVEALAIASEEFFTLTILTENEDSSSHVADQMLTGGDIAQRIWTMQRSGLPVQFVDAFEHSDPDNNPQYLVRVEDVDASNDELGEGRMQTTLRVL